MKRLFVRVILPFLATVAFSKVMHLTNLEMALLLGFVTIMLLFWQMEQILSKIVDDLWEIRQSGCTYGVELRASGAELRASREMAKFWADWDAQQARKNRGEK